MIDDKKIEAAARRYSEVTDCDKQELKKALKKVQIGLSMSF